MDENWADCLVVTLAELTVEWMVALMVVMMAESLVGMWAVKKAEQMDPQMECKLVVRLAVLLAE